MSIQEVRKLFVLGVLKWIPNLLFIEHWSEWRRKRQADAAYLHTKTRWSKLNLINPLL